MIFISLLISECFRRKKVNGHSCHCFDSTLTLSHFNIVIRLLRPVTPIVSLWHRNSRRFGIISWWGTRNSWLRSEDNQRRCVSIYSFNAVRLPLVDFYSHFTQSVSEWANKHLIQADAFSWLRDYFIVFPLSFLFTTPTGRPLIRFAVDGSCLIWVDPYSNII